MSLNALSLDCRAAEPVVGIEPGESVANYLMRIYGSVEQTRFNQLLGAANEFKEGDEIIGVAAADEASRQNARELLAATTLKEIVEHPAHVDQLYHFANKSVQRSAANRLLGWTLGELKQYLLDRTENEIKAIMPGLDSDVIGCVVKLMSNTELTLVGAKIFHPLPGSKIGSKGYLGARVQPNSPTDHPDDIRWQVFDAFAYAVGDVLVGTNPVSSESASVANIERTLKDVLDTFGVRQHLPHCVLSHIDVQAEVEEQHPGLTELWFQSIAGTDAANTTFDVSVEKMSKYAERRTGKYGLYFETGQGADFTNGHGFGFDMVLHESRKYGFARTLSKRASDARGKDAWVHLNDVAGFIGPEVFRSREQLVRCCLEDIAMGKLHGLCIGLDICSTLHMDVSLRDLDWCIEQIMPANPAYLMALPTKIDPMLGYLTTGYQDHVQIREQFGYRVNDAMWKFFIDLGVVDADGQPTEHFGDPTWVYLQYCRRKGDEREESQILDEAKQRMSEVRSRGLFLATGFGARPSQLNPELEREVERIYEDGKESIWSELSEDFIESIPDQVTLRSQATDRSEYILHPLTGESLHEDSVSLLDSVTLPHSVDVQIVISDGLNAQAISDEGHLLPFLRELRNSLERVQFTPAKENMIVTSGRVRTGYRIGEKLFGNRNGAHSIVHLIGERPGTGHHTFSAYLTTADQDLWSKPDGVDHNITKVVSGIAKTALDPIEAAETVSRLLAEMRRDS